MRVVVVGGGVAGLAAATRLVDDGHEVMLLERRAQLGGRAYSVVDEATGTTIDNGQHLVLGSYSALRAFLDRIGARGLAFQERLEVTFLDGERRLRLQAARLPAPLHLLGGLLGFGALGWRDRAHLLKLPGLMESARDDETVERWLDRLGQSEPARRILWRPLARATLNDEPHGASAKMLAAVLREGLFGSGDGARLGFPIGGLTPLYVEPARAYLERAGARVVTSATVEEVLIESHARGVRIAGGERYLADAVVLAVPAEAVAPLVSAVGSEPYFQAIARLEPSPIVSVHLWFEGALAGPLREAQGGLRCQEMLGLTAGDDLAYAEGGGVPRGADFDWIFRHRDHLTLVKSAARALCELAPDEIVARAERLARRVHDIRGARRHARVLKERAATIAHRAGTEALRPKTRTPVGGLFVAGDFVRTGLPATLESAVRAADEACAHLEAWTPPVEKPRGAFVPLGRLTRA